MRLAFALCVLVFASQSVAETIDGIAATVDDVVVTMSDVDRLVALELIPRAAVESDDQYRRRMLEHLIARILQRRDIRRFGETTVDRKIVSRGLEELIARHGSRSEFESLVARLGIAEDQVVALITAEAEVRTYIDERFAPLLFVPQHDVELYYEGPWSQRRRDQGLSVPPLSDVQEELRDVLRAEQLSAEVDKWTRQLRSRAKVDIFAFR